MNYCRPWLVRPFDSDLLPTDADCGGLYCRGQLVTWHNPFGRPSYWGGRFCLRRKIVL